MIDYFSGILHMGAFRLETISSPAIKIGKRLLTYYKSAILLSEKKREKKASQAALQFPRLPGDFLETVITA